MRNRLTTTRAIAIPIFGALALSLAVSCGRREQSGTSAEKGQKWDQQQAELEYRQIQAELKLAQANKPYLVLDLKHQKLEIRLQGATVWAYGMTLENTSSDDLEKFGDRFMGSDRQIVRPILFKYLFAASSRTPDSILAIVSEATTFPPELLQRTIPERFQLKWSEDVVLDIRTDVVGKPQSKWKNTIVDIRQAIAGHLGDALVTVKMPKDNAITLYRAAIIGLPTLIYPAS
jgi:hypothetical protein